MRISRFASDFRSALIESTYTQLLLYYHANSATSESGDTLLWACLIIGHNEIATVHTAVELAMSISVHYEYDPITHEYNYSDV